MTMTTPATKDDIQQMFLQFTQNQTHFIDDKLAEISAEFEAKLKSTSSSNLMWKREGQLAEAERVNQSPKVKAELEQTKKLLEHRQKLIRLADTSPSRWATVEANELA